MSAEQLTPINPLFDKGLVGAFVDGLIKTLGEMAQTKVKPGKAVVEHKATAKGEVAGIIGMVSGEMKGTLLITFSRDSVFKILENMLGETYTDFTPEVKDAVGELTNMIYGSAKTTLNKTGYNFEMAIPTVITGQFDIASVHTGVTLAIPFEVEPGKNVYVEISVQA